MVDGVREKADFDYIGIILIEKEKGEEEKAKWDKRSLRIMPHTTWNKMMLNLKQINFIPPHCFN